MEEQGEIIDASGERASALNFIKEGPKFFKLIKEPLPRENTIASYLSGKETGWKKKERVFSEREGLENLKTFLEEVSETARESDDEAVLGKAKAFMENLVYIGEPELKEAVSGLAKHFLGLAREGKQVYLYVGGLRSERYITLRVLEEVEKLAGDDVKLQEKIRLSLRYSPIAEACSKDPDSCRVAVVDDFIISGTRIQSFASHICQALVEAGVPFEKAAQIIEANVVAAHIRPSPENQLTISYQEPKTGTNLETPLRVYAYYGAREYRGKDGKWVVFTGVSISGSHSSTDYGFESPLEEFQEFLREQGKNIPLPFLMDIKRPYEMEERGTCYKDSELQRRWEEIEEKFGI